MVAQAPRLRARTPEELVDALEQRSQRRIVGGLISLHHRGERRFGPLWKPALAALGAVTAVLAWKLLAARRPPVGGGDPGWIARGLRLAWLWRA